MRQPRLLSGGHAWNRSASARTRTRSARSSPGTDSPRWRSASLLLAVGIWQLLRGMPYSGPPSMSGLIAAIRHLCRVVHSAALLILAGLYTLQPNEARDPAAVRQLSRQHAGAGSARHQSLLHAGARSRCAHAISTASGSRSTTSAAIRSRSPRSSSGASTTRPKASFDVDNYENYVKLQSEAAVRHLAELVRLRPWRHAGRRHAGADAAGAAPTSSRVPWSSSCSSDWPRPASSWTRRG